MTHPLRSSDPVLSSNNERNDLPILRIEARSGFADFGFAEFWGFRHLLFWLAWRDITLRYRQTAIGAAWAVFQPLSMMAIFSITLGLLARVPSGELPYPVLALSGLVMWNLISSVLSLCAQSLVNNSGLITKIYFPRSIITVSAAIAPFLDFLISLVVLAGMTLAFGVRLAPTALLAPLLGIVAMLAALGLGLWFAALNVKYRDIRYVVPFLVQVGLFCSPVVFPLDLVPEAWRTLYAANPAVSLIEGMRWALFGNTLLTMPMVAASASVSVLLFLIGAYYFRQQEKTFADTV